MAAKYELITYNGHNEAYKGKKVRRYLSDGSIRNERGHVIEKLPNNGNDITPENARDRALARWKKYRQAAADAVTKEIASIAPGANTPFAAWGVLNARTAAAIMDSDKPRGRDLEYIGRNMGAISSPDDAEQAQNSVNAGAIEIMEALRDVLRAAGAWEQAKHGDD